MSPRGVLSWSPDSKRVLSTHGHHKEHFAVVDREGETLASVDAGHRVASAAFIDERTAIATCFQSAVIIIDVDSGRVVKTLERPTFEIGVAATAQVLALTADHGLLY